MPYSQKTDYGGVSRTAQVECFARHTYPWCDNSIVSHAHDVVIERVGSMGIYGISGSNIGQVGSKLYYKITFSANVIE